jgi:putative endonuclease
VPVATRPISVAFTYILLCADGSFYVGSTRDLEVRIDEHARGTADSYTISRRPVELVWFHEVERISDAALLERKLKGWRRDKKIALIEGRFGDLPQLARTSERRGPSEEGSSVSRT